MEPSIITIKQLVSEAQCYTTIRQLCWADGVTLNKDDFQYMTEHLRTGIDKKRADIPCRGWSNVTRSTSWRDTKASLKKSPKPDGNPVAAAYKARVGAAPWPRRSRPFSAWSSAQGKSSSGCSTTCNRPPSNPWSYKPLCPAHPSIPKNILSTAVWPHGATRIRRSTIQQGNTPATMAATVSAKSIRTRWKASGRCCAPGAAPASRPITGQVAAVPELFWVCP